MYEFDSAFLYEILYTARNMQHSMCVCIPVNGPLIMTRKRLRDKEGGTVCDSLCLITGNCVHTNTKHAVCVHMHVYCPVVMLSCFYAFDGVCSSWMHVPMLMRVNFVQASLYSPRIHCASAWYMVWSGWLTCCMAMAWGNSLSIRCWKASSLS